jgi:hypothetical protein
MAVTKITDIVYNTAFAQYFMRALTERSALIKSGIAVVDARIAELCRAAGFGGKTINLPYWNAISGVEEVLSDATPLTAGAITAGQDVAVILRRGKAWGVNDLAAEIAGDDPIRMVADRLADYWAARQQVTLFSVLAGVFADNVAANASDLVLDISQETGDDNLLSANTLLFAAQLLGDAKENLAAIAMHSQAETVLNIAGAGGLFKPADTPASLPTYNGRQVVMDDNCSYDPVTGKAEIFLFGRGAVAMNEVPAQMPLETTREALAGNDIVITRRAWITHVRGVKWDPAAQVPAGATPTNAELAGAGNWTRVWDRKDVRVVKLIAKLG